MFQRALSKNTIRRIIVEGEVIAGYPDDCPYPSYLLLGYCEDGPIHIVVAQDKASGQCFKSRRINPIGISGRKILDQGGSNELCHL